MQYDISYLAKYFSLIEQSNEERLESSDLSQEAKERAKIRQEILSQMRNNVQWLMNSPIDRHAARIEWIASLRKRNIDVTSYLKYITIYDKVQECIPYIKVLNQNGQLDDFTSLCFLIIEKIDFRGKLFEKIEIEEMEMRDILLNIDDKIHHIYSIHPECVEKVNELSKLLQDVLLP